MTAKSGTVSALLNPLPASPDAEKTILGAILLDNAAHTEAVKLGLAAADFSLDSHRRIFQRMTAMLKDGRAVDIVTLSEELDRRKEIESIGGRAYLCGLTEGLPRRLRVDEYVRIVRAKTQERAALTLAESITARVNGRADTGAQISAWAADRFAALAEGQRDENRRSAEYADDALALQFTERHGDDLRFTAEWGRWSVWDGSAWRQDKTLSVFDLARKVCREESAGCEDKRLAARIASAVTVAAVERLARADRRHAAINNQWDADPWMLNTPGGIVDLRSGAIRPTRRDDYATKITAAAPGGECPRWLTFLSRITNGSQELQGFMQRMCGYALTGVTREHALFFLYGTGANGKSVFLNTISGLMGDYARTAPIEAFIDSKNEHHPTDLAGLQGARLVTAVETENGARWAESKLKALTGGDRIAARFMRQDFFEFAPVFKLVIAGNHKPGLRTVDEAIKRRFNLLPFTVMIPASERDAELTEKLREEWGGILQWAVDGCLAWQSRGLQTPIVVSEATESYFAAEDALARWIEDCAEKRGGTWERAAVLFSSWKTWAESNGEYVGSQKRFSENLAARGFAQVRTKAARGFSGIRLRTGPVTDGDGSTDYPCHARARNGDNAPTRHNPSPEGDLRAIKNAEIVDSLAAAKARAAEKLRSEKVEL